jgi:hypothetical protein
MQLRHRVGDLLLLRQPLEELPRGPVAGEAIAEFRLMAL